MPPPGAVSLLSAGTQSQLFREGKRVQLDQGQSFFVQGDPASKVGVVIRGHLKLSATGSSGRSVLVAFWGPDDFIGLATAINRTTNLGTAVAMDRVELWAITPARLDELMLVCPDMSLLLVRQLARLAEASERGHSAQGTESSNVRVARLMAELCGPRPGDIGDETTGVDELRFDLSQDELGQVVGLSRQSIARALRSFRAEGIVSTSRRHLTVHRLDRLREIARLPAARPGDPSESLVHLPAT